MTTSLNSWAVVGFYLLAAILSPISVRLLKTFKNKIFIVSICALNLILCCKIAYSSYLNPILSPPIQIAWPQLSFDFVSFLPWSYLSVALALGGGLAIFFIPRQIFHKTSILFLIELALLESLLFANHILLAVSLTILCGLLTSLTFCFSSQANKQTNALTSVLLWHRFSDLLLLFSIASWQINIPANWGAALFLSGIFIRTSPLMLTTSLQSNLSSISPTARTFYFFSMSFSSAVLFIKSNLLLLIPPELKIIFISLYIFSSVFAVLCAALSKNNALIRLYAAFLWITILHVVILMDAANAAQIFLIGTCLFFPVLFNLKISLNHILATEEPLWKALVLSGWKIDNLLETIFLTTTRYLSYFIKEIISPIIYVLWIQVPQIISGFIQIILRILNAGGAQKAITVVILGLTLFLIYYAGI